MTEPLPEDIERVARAIWTADYGLIEIDTSTGAINKERYYKIAIAAIRAMQRGDDQ
jgi:hypothetical protein